MRDTAAASMPPASRAKMAAEACPTAQAFTFRPIRSSRPVWTDDSEITLPQLRDRASPTAIACASKG